MLYLLALLLPFSLFCLDHDPFLPEAPPERTFSPSFDSYLIEGLVNPATGQFSLSQTDLIAIGVEPLAFTRYYYPPKIKNKYSNKKEEDEHLLGMALTRRFGWIFFPHLIATFQHTDTKGRALITITEPDGSMLQFKLHKSGRVTLESPGPFTNSNGETISACYDSRNTRCAIEPGKIIVYSKDRSIRYYERGGSRDGIYNYYLKKERLPSGKVIVYSYDDKRFLTAIESKEPHEKYTYAKITRSSGNEWTTHTGLRASYQFGTISGSGWYVSFPTVYAEYKYQYPLLSKISSSFGNETYGYCPRGTLCWHGDKNPIFSSTYSAYNELLRIADLQLPVGENDNLMPIHRFKYGEQSTIVFHPDGTKSTYYFNKDRFLTRLDHEQKATTYGWDQNHRLSYVEIHGLLRKEYESDRFGNPKKETLIGNLTGQESVEHYSITHEYNDRNLLVKEETDSGLTVTYEYLEGTNLVTRKIIDGDDGLHLEEHYIYDDCNNLIESVVNDKTTRYILRQNYPHLHMVEWIEREDRNIHLHYDQYGHVSQEDHYDAEGAFVYSHYKEYNAKGELISETNPIGQKFFYAYDADARLISKSKPTEHMEYDRRGRLKKFSDALYTTTYKYDTLDNLIEKTDRYGSIYYSYQNKKPIKTVHGNQVSTSTYDAYGRETSRTDANGHTTHFCYNSRNQIIETTHPDGSREYNRYYLNGNLKSHTDPDNHTISYLYDSFDRVTTKIYEGVGEETFTYNTLYLLSHTDLEGYTTYYTYDELGRKIQEERCGRITEYTYDSLSRVATVSKGAITTFYKYDLLDRMIEESTPFSIITYTYDEDGNKSSITIGNNTETFAYDPLKRLIKQTDALGNATTINHTDFQKLTTDAKGLTTIETYDIYENLIAKEIPGVIAFRYAYDLESNLILQEEDVYKNGRFLKTLKTTYNYTPKDELASITKYGETTHYTYTPSGKVQTKTKPDGTILEYSYDSLGYLISIGEDAFVYNKLGHLISGRGFNREVDPFGNVLKETLSNGLTIEKTYDDLDRPLTVTLPTGTIHYTYDLRLKTISYKGFTHFYNYNLAGQMLTNGLTTFTRDLKGQITKLEAPHISQECTYDPLGNLTYATPNSYSYDALSQLGCDFDSHFDLPDAPETGNLASLGGHALTYDKHNRLIQAGPITYVYDALGRRLSKNDERCLYDGLTEIGTFIDGKAYIKINKVLLDLDGKLAVPIFDATYILRYLIDPTTHEILNSYEFDPFGNSITVSESLKNPYRYALKHYDEETGLIYFGKRYYNPHTRRWITPDPVGPIDLINLYVFVRNNPFRYTDYTGLLSCPHIHPPYLAEYPYQRANDLTLSKAPYTHSYTVGYYSRWDKLLIHPNGINSPFARAEDYVRKISMMAGHRVIGVYNPTISIGEDLYEYNIRARPKVPYKLVTSQVSKEIYFNLVKFHAITPPAAKAFVSSHSGGTTEVRNTLRFSQPVIRNRVISVAIGPSAIIPRALCYDSFNYASKRDLVARFAAFIDPTHKNEIIYLEPHPQANKWNDHEWDSPTYQPKIRGHINDYMNGY